MCERACVSRCTAKCQEIPGLDRGWMTLYTVPELNVFTGERVALRLNGEGLDHDE